MSFSSSSGWYAMYSSVLSITPRWYNLSSFCWDSKYLIFSASSYLISFSIFTMDLSLFSCWFSRASIKAHFSSHSISQNFLFLLGANNLPNLPFSPIFRNASNYYLTLFRIFKQVCELWSKLNIKLFLLDSFSLICFITNALNSSCFTVLTMLYFLLYAYRHFNPMFFQEISPYT